MYFLPPNFITCQDLLGCLFLLGVNAELMNQNLRMRVQESVVQQELRMFELQAQWHQVRLVRLSQDLSFSSARRSWQIHLGRKKDPKGRQ